MRNIELRDLGKEAAKFVAVHLHLKFDVFSVPINPVAFCFETSRCEIRASRNKVINECQENEASNSIA